jgi:hypothetical protein
MAPPTFWWKIKSPWLESARADPVEAWAGDGFPQHAPVHPTADLGAGGGNGKVFDSSTGFRLADGLGLSPDLVIERGGKLAQEHKPGTAPIAQGVSQILWGE